MDCVSKWRARHDACRRGAICRFNRVLSLPLFALAAWSVEIAFGWPSSLYARIRHPVVWLGALINVFDRALNRPEWPHVARYLAGAISTLALIAIATGMAWALTRLLMEYWWGQFIEIAIAASLIASRSLFAHVADVARPLGQQDLSGAKQAVAMIVGRDPSQLDDAAVARASLESLAENMSDGVIAPLFWVACLGLPGLVAYKAINTLDSMIGHRSDRYEAFGGFAARLDDIANLVPARLTAALIAVASFRSQSFLAAIRDASGHRSPNAGWPEAAMAGALNVRLSGPRRYNGELHTEPWLNADGKDPDTASIWQGLRLYRRALCLAALILLFVGWSVTR